MRPKKAIRILRSQKEKISVYPEAFDDAWRMETLAYVKEFFGKDSEPYAYFSNLETKPRRTAGSEYWGTPGRTIVSAQQVEERRITTTKCLDALIAIIQNRGVPTRVPVWKRIGNVFVELLKTIIGTFGKLIG